MSHPQPPSSHHACAAFNQIVNQPSPLAHAHLGYAEMESIERELGESLEWERLDDRVASRIAIYRPGTIKDEDIRDERRDWPIENLLKFKSVFSNGLAD